MEILGLFGMLLFGPLSFVSGFLTGILSEPLRAALSQALFDILNAVLP